MLLEDFGVGVDGWGRGPPPSSPIASVPWPIKFTEAKQLIGGRMKKRSARDIPDFSRKQPQATKHGNVPDSRDGAPAQPRQRPVVTPKPVAKQNRRGQ